MVLNILKLSRSKTMKWFKLNANIWGPYANEHFYRNVTSCTGKWVLTYAAYAVPQDINTVAYKSGILYIKNNVKHQSKNKMCQWEGVA